MKTPAILVPLLCLSLASCGGRDGDDAGAGGAQGRLEALPRPERAGGAVTEMPTTPGPGEVPLAGEPPPPPPLFDAETFGMSLPEHNPETGLAERAADDAQAGGNEPQPADAVALVQRYHAAIDARDYALAYGLWADAGGASGQTLDQFSARFAPLVALRAQVGEPGMIEGAAGARYIQVPVGIAETRGDGSVRKRVGVYTLRRSVADGATASQRQWHLSSVDLRDSTP